MRTTVCAPWSLRGVSYLFTLIAVACGGDLNAGWNETRVLIPVNPTDTPEAEPSSANEPLDAGREPLDIGTAEGGSPVVNPLNPILLCNDGFSDSWQGEYAILSAATTGPTLVGLVISTGGVWGNLEANMVGWQDMVTAARQSGLTGIPDPTASSGPPLVRPSDGNVDATEPNQSAGAQFIIDASLQYSTAELPLAVVTGGRLTDVADAYLMDPSVAERIVVFSSLGTATETGGEMGAPNGEMDPWADVIVAQRLRYTQVSGHYDQIEDVPSSFLPQLPPNAFGAWVEAKQPDIWELPEASDQVGVLAVAIPNFIAEQTSVNPPEISGGIPTLPADPEGPVLLVTRVDGTVARERFQQLLLDPATFEPQ